MNRFRNIIVGLFLAASCHAQTALQWGMQQKNAGSGYTTYWATAGNDYLFATNGSGVFAPVLKSTFLTPTAADSAYQPLDSDLTAIAGLATTSFGRDFLTLADASSGRSKLGLGSLSTQSSITTSTATNLTGVLVGNGAVVTATNHPAVSYIEFNVNGSATLDGGMDTVPYPTRDLHLPLNSGTLAIATTTDGIIRDITGNAGTATALQTSRTINGTSFNGTANITVTAAAGTLTGSSLASGVTSSSLTSFGSSIALGTPASGNFSSGTFTWPTFNQNTSGSAATLTTARTIFGQSFNGSANIGGGTITLAGNLTTTGAFNTTFAQSASTTITLPSTSATMARTDAAQTFTGTQTINGGVLMVPAAGSLTQTLSFGATVGAPALLLYDGGGSVRHGWGLQANETQFFGPSGSHFSWNKGGDLQTSGTNEVMRLDCATGTLTITGPAAATAGVVYGTYTVAGFPTTTYLEAVVTDALAPVVGATVVAGGSAKCKVMYNGSAKIVTAVL